MTWIDQPWDVLEHNFGEDDPLSIDGEQDFPLSGGDPSQPFSVKLRTHNKHDDLIITAKSQGRKVARWTFTDLPANKWVELSCRMTAHQQSLCDDKVVLNLSFQRVGILERFKRLWRP